MRSATKYCLMALAALWWLSGLVACIEAADGADDLELCTRYCEIKRSCDPNYGEGWERTCIYTCQLATSPGSMTPLREDAIDCIRDETTCEAFLVCDAARLADGDADSASDGDSDSETESDREENL